LVPVNNNWEEELRRMTKKSDKYARLTMSHRHRHCYANLSHRFIWAPQQTYSLPITSIPLKSLESIQKHARQASLSKMGYNQHFPKAAVYGPLSCGGLNMVILMVEQIIRGLANLHHHLYAQDSISNMIRISIRASQLESGIIEDVMMHPGIKISYLTPTWITNKRQFMAQHDLRLEISNAWTQAPQSQHDRALMEIFSESNMSNFKFFHLNCCRIFLQIATAADIATADGLRLRPEIFKCKKLKDRKSQLLWPNQLELSYLHQRLGKWNKGANFITQYQQSNFVNKPKHHGNSTDL